MILLTEIQASYYLPLKTFSLNCNLLHATAICCMHADAIKKGNRIFFESREAIIYNKIMKRDNNSPLFQEGESRGS